MLKVAVAVLLVAAVVGVGWIVLYEDEDYTVSLRVNRADLSDPDEIPMEVDLRFESRKGDDTRVDRIQMEIWTREGGELVMVKEDRDFVIPAGGEIIRSYTVTLHNIDQVEDRVWVVLDIRLDGGDTKHVEQEIVLDEYVRL